MIKEPSRRVALVAALVLLSGPGWADPAPDNRFRAMVERPLFSPTRRPPPPPPAPLALPSLPAPPLPPPNLTLSGVITGGGTGVALIRRPQDAAPIHVAAGGSVDGWIVAEIHPREIVLRRDARSVTVALPSPGR